MASLYKRGETFWIAFTVNGRRVLRSLHTANERIACDKKKQLEYELMIGDLQTESRLELPFILEEFCHATITPQTAIVTTSASRWRRLR